MRGLNIVKEYFSCNYIYIKSGVKIYIFIWIGMDKDSMEGWIDLEERLFLEGIEKFIKIFYMEKISFWNLL